MHVPVPNYSFYVITDCRLAAGRPIRDIVAGAIQGGATCIQVREKEMSSRDLYHLSLQLRTLTREKQIPLIINDRLDIALAVGADGIHLGQEDLPAAVARRLIPPDMILGVSAENVRQALEAQAAGANYLGVGAVYATSTKPDAGEPMGLAALAEICRRVDLPVVGIGGIHAGNAGEVIAAGAQGVAVVSCVVAAERVAEAARAVAKKVQEALSSGRGRP